MSATTALSPVGGAGTTRVRVHVPFDLRHSADLRQELVTAVREGGDLVLVDISESTVVDQVGFATLVAAHARVLRGDAGGVEDHAVRLRLAGDPVVR